jgi:tetratricopeptide (TPR) repeat protein
MMVMGFKSLKIRARPVKWLMKRLGTRRLAQSFISAVLLALDAGAGGASRAQDIEPARLQPPSLHPELHAAEPAAEPPRTLVGRARDCNARGEYEAGRAWAEKALALDPKLAEAHTLLAEAASEMASYDVALIHYRAALAIHPDTLAYRRAAHLAWLTGDGRKGRWLLEKAITAGGLEPEATAACRCDLAMMLWHDGALLAAEQQAESALRHAPSNAVVLATMGRIKTARNDYTNAIDFYQRAIQIAPAHESLVALGDLYTLTNQRDAAETQYKRAVEQLASDPVQSAAGWELLPTHPPAQLARFYAGHDRNLDEALCAAESAYRRFKTVAIADTLAWCYYKKGRYQDARETIVKALRWKTPDASILFHAGMICQRTGESGEARLYLYRALNLNPRFHPTDAAVAAETLKSLSKRASEASAAAEKPGS